MKFVHEGRNGGLLALDRDHPIELREIQEVLSGLDYHAQICRQRTREQEMIFSPSLNNAAISGAFTALGWDIGVPLLNPTPESGRDVDCYKNGVVIEVQFAHYALLSADVARMERLFRGELRLRTRTDGRHRPVNVGVEIVVDRTMPTSNGVARWDQLKDRAAPLAQTLPLLMVGILPPAQGEEVVFHDTEPRQRKSLDSRRVPWP